MPLNTPLMQTLAQVSKQRQQRTTFNSKALQMLQSLRAPTGRGTVAPTNRFNSAALPVGGKLQGAKGIVQYGKQFLGTPYVWGGTTPKGFDCSGFVQYVYKKFGVNLPRVSQDQAAYGKSINASQARKGDLVYYGKGTGVHHIGIYLGNGRYLEAPHTGDVVKIAPIGNEIGGFTRVLK